MNNQEKAFPVLLRACDEINDALWRERRAAASAAPRTRPIVLSPRAARLCCLALSGTLYEGLLYAAHNNRFERFTVFRPPALPEVGDSRTGC
jgi:hypothetical protein